MCSWLVSYTSGLLSEWQLPVEFDAGSAAGRVPRSPVLVLQVRPFFSYLPGRFGAGRRWGHLDDDVDGSRTNGSCRSCCSVPGSPQTCQRAELWGVILALQAAGAVHLGADNLNVVRHVGRLLDGNFGPCPAELANDGDLLKLIS